MSIYLIALTEPSQETWSRLEEHWPDHHYIFTDYLAFVAPEKNMLTEDVRDIAGMNDESEVDGLVTEINYDTTDGWTRRALWEWLKKNQ